MKSGQIIKEQFKFIIVSDSNIKQVSLLNKYVEKTDDNYEQTVLENITLCYNFQDSVYNITLWLTDGQQEYEKIMRLGYSETDTVILLFSYEAENSLKNIATKWIPEFKNCIPDASIYLVGLHGSPEKEMFDIEQVRNVAESLKLTYFDCKSSDNREIKKLFNKIFDDYLWKLAPPCRFTFFKENFQSVNAGLKFAEQAAWLSRGHIQEESILNMLPPEVFFLILTELGSSLIKDIDNAAALVALCRLVYGNVSGEHQEWKRQFEIKNESLQIYPEREEKQPKHRKRCMVM